MNTVRGALPKCTLTGCIGGSTIELWQPGVDIGSDYVHSAENSRKHFLRPDESLVNDTQYGTKKTKYITSGLGRTSFVESGRNCTGKLYISCDTTLNRQRLFREWNISSWKRPIFKQPWSIHCNQWFQSVWKYSDDHLDGFYKFLPPEIVDCIYTTYIQGITMFCNNDLEFLTRILGIFTCLIAHGIPTFCALGISARTWNSQSLQESINLSCSSAIEPLDGPN